MSLSPTHSLPTRRAPPPLSLRPSLLPPRHSLSADKRTQRGRRAATSGAKGRGRRPALPDVACGGRDKTCKALGGPPRGDVGVEVALGEWEWEGAAEDLFTHKPPLKFNGY
uniref:Uncharacterized protein n=1 Tax=Oryza rufipogon TaxID=4529 RepID=A0A0E0NBV1_ORYRU